MRNGARYICETLESVFSQSRQDFEIILVDDGSTDGGAEMAARRFDDPRLTIVRQPPLTLREARPAAFARCHGEFIAFDDGYRTWSYTYAEVAAAARAFAARLRAQGLPTVPSCLDLELRTNPFLRARHPDVRAAASQHAATLLDTPQAVFACLRQWKNDFT